MAGSEPPEGPPSEEEHPDDFHGSQEEIDETVDETFPASDAPQWWSGDRNGDG